MGLLIKLKNGDTQLKSLKFGKDQPGGGDSNQPFIKKSIEQDSKNPAFYNDFILRGGIEAPLSAAEDVARLTKYFFNFNNPSGFLFTAKQNILSRSGTKTEASRGIAYLGGGLNEGAYTPLSTLAEAGVGFLGIHLNKQGLDPTGLIPSLSIKNYQDAIKQNQLIGPFIPENNRLTQLTSLISQSRSENNFSFVKGYGLNVGNSVVSYTGGSDSVVGVGTTYVKFATDNADVPLKTLTPKPSGYLTQNRDYFIPTGSIYKPGQPLVKNPDKYLGDELTDPLILTVRNDLNDYLVGKTSKNKISDGKWKIPIGASFEYNFVDRPSYTPPSTFSLNEFENGATTTPPDFAIENNLIKGPDSYELYDYTSVYKPGTLVPINGLNSYLEGKSNVYNTNSDINLPLSASVLYNSIKKPKENVILDGLTKENQISYVRNPLEFSITSVYEPGTLIPIPDIKKYLTRQDSNSLKITKLDINYSSSISQKLKNFGRQLITFPQYNAEVKHYTGVDPTKKYLGFYSSFNTLKVDSGIANEDKDKWKDLQSKPIKGYLANLNKNAGDYEKADGIKTLNNPYRVGGRGISFDFRLVDRKKRGFKDYPTPYDYITTTGSDYSKNEPYKPLDRIYYDSEASKRTSNSIASGDDIIKFRITVVNPTSPSDSSNTLNFRAYIDDFSDSYSADWGSQTYMGRGEKFYKYNSFNRDISLGFTIVADSESNLNTMYNQLNLLAASIAPTYTDAGYMAGNLHRLTVGDYLYEQWGVMSGFTYEIIEDSPWEITEGKQVPLYIKVSGIKFTPIHNFRPASYFNGVNKYILQNVATNNS